jgi:micrococcal nuclease
MRRSAPFFLALAALVSCAPHQIDLSRQAPATLRDEPRGHEAAVVTRVVDGDTIVVEVTDRSKGPGAGRAQVGEEYKIRLIGIDTPESVDPRSPVECFGAEASEAATALLEGAEVRMVKDVSETDRFDRLVRYIYLDEEMANARLVVNGYASAYTYPPDVRHSELFVELEQEARDGERGLWSPDTCDGKP